MKIIFLVFFAFVNFSHADSRPFDSNLDYINSVLECRGYDSKVIVTETHDSTEKETYISVDAWDRDKESAKYPTLHSGAIKVKRQGHLARLIKNKATLESEDDSITLKIDFNTYQLMVNDLVDQLRCTFVNNL